MDDKPIPQPSIEDYATIESYCDGVPVYSFSNIAYIYGVSPDLAPGVVMQEGTDARRMVFNARVRRHY